MWPKWLPEEAREQIAKSVQDGNTWTTAVAAAGVDPAEVYKWASASTVEDKAFAEFTTLLRTARAKAEQAMTEALTADAKGGFLVRKYTKIFPNGDEETDETYSPPNGRVALSWLQSRNGQQWGKPDQPSDMLGDTSASAAPGGAAAEQGTIEAMAERLHAMRAEQLSEQAEDDAVPGGTLVPGRVLPPGGEG